MARGAGARFCAAGAARRAGALRTARLRAGFFRGADFRAGFFRPFALAGVLRFAFFRVAMTGSSR
jgi:hypothetical protein